MDETSCVECNAASTEEGAGNVAIQGDFDHLHCIDPTGNCSECCKIFLDASKRRKFGILKGFVKCMCHDICVQEVRLICAQDIDCIIPIPTRGDGLVSGSCRGELDPLSPDVTCEVLIVCAEEELQFDCKGVDIRIGFQIILRQPAPCPILVVEKTCDFKCTTFFTFPEGEEVRGAALRRALREIDGSCIVVQDLKCVILDRENPRVRITGKLVDKLWKYENLWVSAIRPYEGISIKREFPEPHKIGECR